MELRGLIWTPVYRWTRIHTAEVAGSNPASPTQKCLQMKENPQLPVFESGAVYCNRTATRRCLGCRILRTLLARLSFSGGVGQWREGEDAEGLFSRADATLYRAKGTDKDPSSTLTSTPRYRVIGGPCLTERVDDASVQPTMEGHVRRSIARTR
jgi:hypothetical protein